MIFFGRHNIPGQHASRAELAPPHTQHVKLFDLNQKSIIFLPCRKQQTITFSSSSWVILSMSRVLLVDAFPRLVSPDLGYPQMEAVDTKLYKARLLAPANIFSSSNISVSDALCWDKRSPLGLLPGAALPAESQKVCLF